MGAFNGWTNRETWVAASWIAESSAADRFDAAAAEFIREGEKDGYDVTTHGFKYGAAMHVAEDMQDWYDEQAYEISRMCKDHPFWGMFDDMQFFAAPDFSVTVNWIEIAKHHVPGFF